MASSLQSTVLRRSTLLTPCTKQSTTQIRHASLLKRPIRPYTFTQLITLSDGSTYTQRTTSPAPTYKSSKDTRNSILWQPSMTSLRNIEEDEAGRLRAFRNKFGRGWDLEANAEVESAQEGEEAAAAKAKTEEREESLMDLISAGFENNAQAPTEDGAAVKAAGGKGKKGKK